MNRFQAKARIVEKFGSQTVAARALGIHPARFSLLLNGLLRPNAREQEKIREALGGSLLKVMQERYRAAGSRDERVADTQMA
jgi:hypothetical protein